MLVARHLLELYRGWGLGRLRVVQNPVDRRRFAPCPKDRGLLNELRIDPESVVVLHASNLKDIKRPLDIVESANQTLRENPRLVYVIVGDGPMRAAVVEECRRRRAANSFRLVDWVDHEAMPSLLNLADIVVMPSQTEAMALVYLETLACARVLLASDIPAAREVVRDGRDGVLFRCGDVQDLTAKTLRLAASGKLRAAIGARARERSRRFALGRFLDSYASLLTEVVRRPVC